MNSRAFALMFSPGLRDQVDFCSVRASECTRLTAFGTCASPNTFAPLTNCFSTFGHDAKHLTGDHVPVHPEALDRHKGKNFGSPIAHRAPFDATPHPRLQNDRLKGLLPPPRFTGPRVRHRERGSAPGSFGQPRFPKAFNLHLKARSPIRGRPSHPCGYCKCGIGLK